MSSIIYSIAGIYFFILIGYLAKMSFKDEIDEKTITIINVYFLQVFLTFWGLLIRPIDITLLFAPSIYFLVTIIVLIFSAFVAKKIFLAQKERGVATVSAIIGNTGNLGIPLCIAIFGEESIPYVTVINLVNIFVVYTFGVFYYSRGAYDTKTSLKNIVKLPILWAATLAIALSFFNFVPNEAIMKTLMMGAYASMTMQLFLFGIYLYGTKISEISKKLTAWVMGMKFIIIPAISFLILYNIELDLTIKGIIFIELLTPLAVANVNIASLYDCEPRVVTALVFISSALFLGVIFVGIKILKFL
ncbi:MAG: AEC family transporter [Sulfurimonas sp.]|uniref:AEC family transporter n=1 Tax=Sulfurimonas sp. TaxID=2022749 RepID=UPI00263414B2|nr:AEC family transporter [Sulfurimonas sp.]MDD5401620.1 AEC family transporter [Sulfurimonas sp.]